MDDLQAVFFPEWYLDVKVVQCDLRDAPVPAAARGACQTWGTFDAPKNILLNNCTTAGPIGLKLGMRLGTLHTMRDRMSEPGCYSTCARA